jgi:multidrug efflux system membrane fusion protein
MHRIFYSACLASLMLAGCNRGNVKVAPTETPTLPVAQPKQDMVTDFVEYIGRTSAKDSVVIQPRVTGYLMPMARPYTEGDEVKKGEVLFEVDPEPYQAQYEAALAAVAQNEAGLKYAKETNQQFLEIYAKQKDAVTLRELHQYAALEDQAVASLNYTKANLKSAKLNLDLTKVKSPIDGRISRYYLTPGNLVNQDVTQLTLVVSMNPMYVFFDMDEPTYLRMKRALAEGEISQPRLTPALLPYFGASTFGLLASPIGERQLAAASAALAGLDAPVQIGLQGEEGFPHNGSINFIDNQFNAGTGSILVRGVFANPRPAKGDYLMTPGNSVRVHMPISKPHKALLVIDRAIVSEQGRKQVFVVNADNKVEVRPVTTGALQPDGQRVITSGLKKDDWVLTGGLQQVQNGMTVQTQRLERMPIANEPARIDETAKKTAPKKKAKN